MSQLFPTKFVADVGTFTMSATDTTELLLKVDGQTVLRENYTPAGGQIIVRGLRNVLEAALYGELRGGAQTHATADVVLMKADETVLDQRQLFASRLRNPRDAGGVKTVMAAGDLVAVADADGMLATAPLLTVIDGNTVTTQLLTPQTDADSLGDRLTLWVERTACLDDAVAVRFLNRYDMPQTMMTPRPLEVKPGFSDQTQLMNGRAVRFSVDQQDEWTLRSARIHSRLEYASWYDLLTSRRAEVLMGGEWLPIVVTKSNVNIVAHASGLNPVELTFRMADPRQGI